MQVRGTRDLGEALGGGQQKIEELEGGLDGA